MSSARANRRGMLALMGAMAAFAINDMLLKLTAQRYPLGEVITVRGTIARHPKNALHPPNPANSKLS